MYMKTRVTKYRIVFKISFFTFIGNIIDACTNNPLCNDSIEDSSQFWGFDDAQCHYRFVRQKKITSINYPLKKESDKIE